MTDPEPAGDRPGLWQFLVTNYGKAAVAGILLYPSALLFGYGDRIFPSNSPFAFLGYAIMAVPLLLAIAFVYFLIRGGMAGEDGRGDPP